MLILSAIYALSGVFDGGFWRCKGCLSYVLHASLRAGDRQDACHTLMAERRF